MEIESPANERGETVMVKTRDGVGRAGRLGEERQPKEAVIARDVLGRLGEPGRLHRVQVRPVFAGKYRVNVYVGADAASYRVAHSYFVEADGDGKVLASSPAITRLY
jgi:hypothetical protein